MKTKVIIEWGLIISFAISLGIFHNLYTKSIKSNCDEMIESFNSQLFENKIIKQLELETNNQTINNASLFDSNYCTVNLFDLIQEETVIFRFSENSCNPCLLENIEEVRNNQKLVPTLLLGSFTSFDAYLSFIRKHNLQNVFMFVTDSSFNDLSVEHQYQLYYFIANKRKKVTNIYIPQKGVHETTKLFFREAKRIINN
jgi:hypothetical protein